ncbi:hypothetical protein G3495_18835 [Shewanella baltica]|uniref:hypothetical protein n=1 Tax=Shewanella baltica TaxID=62322 RepID=UPI00217ED78C|nr:hypothetical protein [Shewanella baltica]MCS6237147.1 hypothetical protein [Shewanella baltica]
MSTQETAALIESVNKMTETVAGKVGQIDAKINEMDSRFQAEVEKFYSVGSFKNLRKGVGWIGDATHYNYVLLHMEPSVAENAFTDSSQSGYERFGFAQYGEIFSARIASGYSSLIFGRFLFHSARGFNDVSSAKVESAFSVGISNPVIVKNFPHDGKLFRAIRFNPMSDQWQGLSISVSYSGDFRGTGSQSRDAPDHNYWLKSIGVASSLPQPGEVVV